MNCRCHHSPAYLIQEIGSGRPVQEFREIGGREYQVVVNTRDKVEYGTGTYQLFCRVCNELWDHETTDRLIEHVMILPRTQRKRMTSTEALPVAVAIEEDNEAPRHLVDQTAYRARKKLPPRPFTREMYSALQLLRPQSRADARDKLEKNLAYFAKVAADLQNPPPREPQRLEKEYGGKCKLPNLKRFVAKHGGDCNSISMKAWDQFNREIEDWKACVHCDDNWFDPEWRRWFARKTIEIWGE